MILSQENKYVFIEFPRTGSTAISRELVQRYGGKRILRKHSSYNEFLRVASAEERNYFVFSCVRNPLDDAVSHYFKLKTNHRGWYTDEEIVKSNTRLAERVDIIMFRWIQKHDASFEDFFLQFYKLPYNNWASLSRGRYNFIIRFENIEEDFEKAIRMLGLELQRPLPPRNTTSGRSRDWQSYYTPRIIPRAVHVFGPFMKEWGYEFPAEWGDLDVPGISRAEFSLLNIPRTIYWKYFRAHF